ncbi:nitroreductase [Lactiplantibacillus mudanjiangensis]|uniref:Nitroreductase [Lactobacillus zymae] n=1 Tax=Lactiplantibacillus mudanjiangensis TaxID=1296538 RepID=A0A660E5D4_9LACO|nr:nitroreductase [Lactiplantibacillus mudanjiangensis]VDG24736.1 Nitroreductase [Lactobacillus zymae] [Lactiplantibacillus mudanjiangensis]VDG29348.1 Nitroreductase [Lactobacillus zymae] [Lactiplantibacillus mudanjiangensis]
MTDLIMNRHSSRDFDERPVSTDLITKIVSEAQQAPSWENTQPVKVYVAKGKIAEQIRNQHSESVSANQKSWTEVIPPQSWAKMPKNNMDQWLADTANFFGTDMEAFKNAQQHLFKAPVILYITVPKDSSNYSTYDAGAFGYGVLLSASSNGLGAIPAYEFIRFPEEIHAHFSIPSDESLLMGIGLGYASKSILNDWKPKRTQVADILQIKE